SDIALIMAEAAARQGSVGNDPLRGAPCVVQIHTLARHGVRNCQRANHPAVLARVAVLVDNGNAELSACSVVQREVLSRVLTSDEIRILTRVERTFGTAQERSHVTMQIANRLQVLRIAELAVPKRV